MRGGILTGIRESVCVIQYGMVGYMVSYSNPESYIPASYATAGSYAAG